MYTNIDDSQIKKGILELLILIVLKKEKYGAEIVSELEKHNTDLPEGTLYTILSRLNKKEYVSYRWQESSGGPPRKYFLISKSGQEYLKESLEILNNLNQIIKKLS